MYYTYMDTLQLKIKYLLHEIQSFLECAVIRMILKEEEKQKEKELLKTVSSITNRTVSYFKYG